MQDKLEDRIWNPRSYTQEKLVQIFKEWGYDIIGPDTTFDDLDDLFIDAFYYRKLVCNSNNYFSC
jgi:hypothetical protein